MTASECEAYDRIAGGIRRVIEREEHRGIVGTVLCKFLVAEALVAFDGDFGRARDSLTRGIGDGLKEFEEA